MTQPVAMSLGASLYSAFEKALYCDCVVKFNGIRYSAHKIVLCTRSLFFSGVFSGSFSEANINEVEIKDVSTEDLQTLLGFLYNDWYGPEDVNVPKKRSLDISLDVLQKHVRMYALADRFLVPSLKVCATSKFKDALMSWNNVASRATVATSTVVQQVYTTTPTSDRGLRDALCEYLKNDVKKLLRDENFIKVLETTEGFGIELFKLYATGSCV